VVEEPAAQLVGRRGGYVSVSFTLDRYGHLYPEADAALPDRLGPHRSLLLVITNLHAGVRIYLLGLEHSSVLTHCL
jgi:hypothetical protein